MTEKQEMKKWTTLILFTIVSYWLVNNLSVVGEVISRVINVLFPFILGGIIAFILNIPMTKIEKFLKDNNSKKNKKIPTRVISIILSLLLLVAVIALVAFLLIPELIENIQVLLANIPYFIADVESWVINLLDKYPDIQIEIENMFKQTGNIKEIVTDVLNYIISGAVGFISSLVSGFVTFFTAIVFSIYMLSQKEYLQRATKKLLNAYLNKKHVKRLEEIGALANQTFSKFISGQCVEAVILGVLIFIACTICQFPYALIIAVLTAVTALIPIFGAMIAMVVGALLIAINNPIQALLFIVVYQIVQQIEGNFIYPKVVGKSVGLSPMWTLLAITAGGSLFGIVGMLVGLPLASIVYSIIRNDINKKIEIKE